jgi:hypothetical protein
MQQLTITFEIEEKRNISKRTNISLIELQADIDNEEVSPFLEMMFGQLHSTKKMLLVW